MNEKNLEEIQNAELSLAGVLGAPPEFGSSLNPTYVFQPEGADYAHHINGSIPGFGNLTTALL